MYKIMIALSFLVSTSSLSMSLESSQSNGYQLSYKTAAESAFRGVLTYGGKQFVLYSILLAGANPGTITIFAVSTTTSYVAGYGFDKVMEYMNSAPLQASSQSVEEIMADFSLIEENSSDTHDDDLDEFTWLDLPAPTTLERMGNKVNALYLATNQTLSGSMESLYGAVQNLPTTATTVVQNAPQAIWSGAMGTLASRIIKAVAPFELLSIAGEAFMKDLGKQTYNLLFIDTLKPDCERHIFSELVDENNNTPCVYRYFDKLIIIDDYNPQHSSN